MRRKSKYPGLEKKYTLKIRQDLIDQDYIDKLSEEEKRFLSDFNEEWTGANFNHEGKILHDTEDLKKQCRRKNYQRNNDIFAIKQCSEMLKDTSEIVERQFQTKDEVENTLIEALDKAKFLKGNKKCKNT